MQLASSLSSLLFAFYRSKIKHSSAVTRKKRNFPVFIVSGLHRISRFLLIVCVLLGLFNLAPAAPVRAQTLTFYAEVNKSFTPI